MDLIPFLMSVSVSECFMAASAMHISRCALPKTLLGHVCQCHKYFKISKTSETMAQSLLKVPISSLKTIFQMFFPFYIVCASSASSGCLQLWFLWLRFCCFGDSYAHAAVSESSIINIWQNKTLWVRFYSKSTRLWNLFGKETHMWEPNKWERHT